MTKNAVAEKITHIERGNLHLAGNLSDAQVYWPLEPAHAKAVEQLDPFHLDRSTISVMEQKARFRDALSAFYPSLKLPEANELMLTYSASNAMEVVLNVLRISAASEIQLLHPTFDATYHSAKRHGLNVASVDEDLAFSGHATWASGAPPQALIITIPNNPTGRTLSRDAFVGLCRACARDGVRLILDCCFRAYEHEIVDHYEIVRKTGVEAAIIEDTGKLFNLLDAKLGVLWATSGWRNKLADVHKDFILEAPLLNLLVLSQLLEADPEYRETLRTRIACNREFANTALAPYDVQPVGDEHSAVQLYKLPHAMSARQLSISARAVGLGVVEADAFFWADMPRDQYIRIALARKTTDFKHQVSTLCAVIASLRPLP